MDSVLDDFTTFASVCLLDLLNYVVPITHKDEEGTDSIGSGVLVRVDGRHIVATARHCIEYSPQVMRSEVRLWTSPRKVDTELRV
jgi:hypothetical protein